MGQSLGNTGMARRAYFNLQCVIQEFYDSMVHVGLTHAQSVDTSPTLIGDINKVMDTIVGSMTHY